MKKSKLAFIAAVGALLPAAIALGQEEPPGCNGQSVGLRLVPFASPGGIVNTGTCVIPGQMIQYKAAPFVSPNPPRQLNIVYCDIEGGQLSVTFPNWVEAQSTGTLDPGQFNPVAGYPMLPPVSQFGNGEDPAFPPIPLFDVPALYPVDPDDADAQGVLRARADYGQTSFLNSVMLVQMDGTVLGNPPQQSATTTITNALPMCLPSILLEKTADPAIICDGTSTPVTYTYMVTNTTTPPAAEPDTELPNLTNVELTDDTCGVISGPLNDDGDGVLNPGETWIYTCTADVSSTTTNTAVVTSNAQALLPAGLTIDTVVYMDTDQATVTTEAPPTVTIDPAAATICAGETQQFCAVPADGTPPYTFEWMGPGGFSADTECITVGDGGEYCVTVTDDSGCQALACVTLTVNPGPDVSIDPPDATVCTGDTQELCAVVTGNGPFDYAWTGPGGFTADTECVTVGDEGQYCVTVTDADGCTGMACATLTVAENLDVTIDPPAASACEGDTAQLCAVLGNGRPPFEYAWTGPGGFASTSECITVGVEGEYCVTVTDDNGCMGMACATLTINNQLDVSVDPPTDTICSGETTEFCAVVAGGAMPFEYAWTGPGGFSANTECITVGTAGDYCVTVTDANGCSGQGCATLNLAADPPCSIDGPVAVNENTTENFCGPAGAGLSYLWSAAGQCVLSGPDDGQCVDVAIGDFPGTCTLSLTVTSGDGCTTTCEREIGVICVDDCPDDPGTCTEKGSLLIWSKVELRWSTAGEIIQDTFISIINDFPEDVRVLLYFINGDEPIPGSPGWNWVDNEILLTKNEPAYWSALTGQPKGVSPFTVLDPGFPPGRVCPDNPNERCLRGYIIGWAINADGEEIKWNHLAGTATLVNYRHDYAWEYNACGFPAADPALPNGSKLPTPGCLQLDGTEYAPASDVLILDFYASGSTPFASGDGPNNIVAETDLTLHPLDADLRQETEGPVTVKASFNIWNENEVKFSGTDRCITCWDQTLLRDYGIPNHFLVENLQTNKGKARIDGLESQLCPDSQANALLGVVARFLDFNDGMRMAASGRNLHGAGLQGGIIKYDPVGGPPEALDPDDVIQSLLDAIRHELDDPTR